MNIVKQALYRNTLVVLPTGLGKTFIAAVVMYNLYRWYPKGKVIFMAPTRPLVTQQIEACQHIMPFPSSETVELTGKLSKTKRAELWRTKRVFFATPQSVQSDILGTTNEEDADEPNECSEIFPFKDVKLLVVDEAHKARGRYAYVEVTQALFQKNKYFRMLALSATPGRSVDDIAEVCSNLLISHLEVRWDTSIDVMPYVHKRNMKTVVVPLGDKIKALRERLMEIVDPYLRQLIDSEVLRGSIANINRNFLLFEQKRFKERSLQQRHNQHSMVISNFSFCISFFHAFELLERHGIRVFLNYFEEDEEGRNKFLLNIDRNLRDLVYELRAEVGPNPFDVSTSAMTNGMIPPMPKNLDFGHPKFEEARKVMLEHFEVNLAISFVIHMITNYIIFRNSLNHVPFAFASIGNL